MTWNRNHIAMSSLLTSASNFVAVFVLATKIAGSVAALWLFTRAACQLAMVLVPSPIAPMLMNPDGDQEVDFGAANRSESSIAVSIFLVGTLSACAIALFGLYFAGTTDRSLVLLMVVYCYPFCAASILGGLARARMRSDIILRTAKIEAFIGLMSVLALFFGFYAFIALALLQLLTRAKIYMTLVTARQRLIYPLRVIMRAGLPIYSRNISQVLSQYGDRLTTPFVFGVHLAGLMGTGASAAALTSIFSSSAAAYSLPKMLRDEPQASSWLMLTWGHAVFLAGALPVLMLYGMATFGYRENAQTIAMGAYFAATMGTVYLATLRRKRVLLSATQPVQNLLLAGCVYLSLAGLLKVGAGLALSVIGALLLVPLYLCVIGMLREPELIALVRQYIASALLCLYGCWFAWSVTVNVHQVISVALALAVFAFVVWKNFLCRIAKV